MKIIVLLLLAVAAESVARAADPLSEALQRGLLAEEAQRDLAAASAAYREAIRLGDAQRALVATALFRLAETERLQGRTNEAFTLYRRLVREHADATNLVTLAQRQLPSGGLPTSAASGPEVYSLLRRDLDDLTARSQSLGSLIERFSGLTNDPVALARAITSAMSAPEVSQLLGERNQAEVALTELKVQYGPKHPKRQEAEAILNRLDGQITAQGLAIVSNLITLRSQAVLDAERKKEQIAMIESAMAAATPSTAALTEPQRLLREEIVLAEQQLEMVKRRQEAGRAEAEEVFKASREVLSLKRQLATMVNRDLVVSVPVVDAAAEADEEDREIQRLKRMLANSPDLLNAPQGPENETPLQTAARLDQGRVAQFLLQSGANINAIGKSGTTALYKAAVAGHKKMVDFLISAGADVNAPGPESWTVRSLTPLMGAVAAERPVVIQTLLAAGASPSFQSGLNPMVETRIGSWQQVSPLGLAVLFKNSNWVEAMAAKGADLNAPAQANAPPLMIALRQNDWDTAFTLLRLGADPNRNHALIQAAGYRSVPANVLDQLLGAGTLVNSADPGGTTPLQAAIIASATNTVSWLLAHNADPNAADPQGTPPIMMAFSQRFIERNQAQTEGRSINPALDARLQATLDGILSALFAAHADVNSTNKQGLSPLFMAASSGDTNSVMKLLAAGANPNLRVADSAPLLNLLVRRLGNDQLPERHYPRRNDFANLEALLKAGANPNEEWYELTPLHDALFGPPEFVELLLAHQADPNRRNGQGQTALERLMDPELILPPGRSTSAEQRQAVAALLRAAGARDDVPDFRTIKLIRPSANVTEVVFQKGPANLLNHFTLLDLLAVHYNVVEGPNVGKEKGPRRVGPRTAERFSFPNWARIVIRRPTEDGTRWTEIPANLEAALMESGCSNNVSLQWGDLVELPERDHLANDRWETPAQLNRRTWVTCLARKITFTVKDQTTSMVLSVEPGGPISNQDPFTLTGALARSGLIRGSSDLSRVTVRRRDPVTGQTAEAIFNCRNREGDGGSVWVNEGDEITVPELR